MREVAIRFWPAVFALGALSACAGMATVQPANVSSDYYTGIVQYIASRGGLPTEVSGNPFASSDEQVHATVRDTMAKSHFGLHFPFLAEKPQGFSSPYRMVVVLDSTAIPAYHKLCEDAGPKGGPRSGATKADGGEVRVAAALCAGDSMVSGTAGRVSGVRGPDDPGFITLIAQVTHELFPRTDEHDDREPKDIIVP
jgi:hypothetical protein